MFKQPGQNRHSRMPLLVLIGTIALCAISEAVLATSLAKELHSLRHLLIESENVKTIRYDASFLLSENTSGSDSGTSPNTMVAAECITRQDLPEGVAGFMDRPEPPASPRIPRPSEGPPPRHAARDACLADLDWQMAIYGDTTSKLQLSESQQAGWKVLEEAVDAPAAK